jgi:hypothetical protein
MSSATSKISQGRQGALLPAFSTLKSCRAWLDAQARGDPDALLVEVERQLGRLNGHQLPAAERFAILEMLRPPIHAALAENRKEFADRPLPLRLSEQAALESSLAAWSALANGYLRCVDACREREPGTAGQMAVAAQRALSTLAELQLDCYRSGHDMTEGHWRSLHRTYGAAEEAGVAGTAVTDPLRPGRFALTPLGAWAECQLLHLASLHELPARQVDWVAHWARRWSGKLELRGDPAAAGDSPSLYADIGSDQPAGYRAGTPPGQRILDTAQLRRSLKKRILALEGGKSPDEVGLGEDCVLPQARELLVQIYSRWCKGGAVRRHERRGADGTCLVVGGLEAAHFHISGGMAVEAPAARALSDSDIRRQREELAVFGRILAAPAAAGGGRPGAAEPKPQYPPLEVWRLIDQSATGVRLLRPGNRAGQRVIGKQLVAVRAPDMKVLHLGTVRRATINDDGDLHAGVRIFAGEPAPVLVRGTGVNAPRSKPAPAFFLPDIAPLGEPSTIILPSGWFKRERVLEILPGQGLSIRLTGLVERGSDYERASYEPLPATGKRD